MAKIAPITKWDILEELIEDCTSLIEDLTYYSDPEKHKENLIETERKLAFKRNLAELLSKTN